MSLQALRQRHQQLKKLLRSNPKYLVDWSFPPQASFIEDKAKLISAKCTRRAGKSNGVARRLIKDAMETPKCNVLYVALTKASARSIMWKDGIKELDSKYGYGMRFNETLLEATLENGSVIKLTGLDATAKEMEKVLGSKYKFIALDEAGSYNQNLYDIVYEMLKPTTVDYDGSIALIGTPHFRTFGLFFDVTTGKEPGWSTHQWNTFDNPYMTNQWAREIEEIKTLRPNFMDTPAYRRMYLGEWYIDLSKLVYKFQDGHNEVASLADSAEPWEYVLGVDLGFSPDPSAFVLSCYRAHDPNLYIIETFQKTEMIISDVKDKILEYMRRFPRIRIVIDAANKQAVEEMRQRYGLPLMAASKTGKSAFIELMNSAMIQGHIKVVSGNQDIIDEWKKLVWVDSNTKREEDPSCANHISDAALYGYREAFNYLAKPKERIDYHGEQAVDRFWDREAERVLEEVASERDLEDAPGLWSA